MLTLMRKYIPVPENVGGIPSKEPIMISHFTCGIFSLDSSEVMLFRLGLMDNASASSSIFYMGKIIHQPITRKVRVRALHGKYSFVGTSSEQFAQRKQEEMVREG